MQVVRIRQNGNSLAITLPRAYATRLGWQLGQSLMIMILDDGLWAAPVRPYPQPVLRTPAHPTEAHSAST